MPADDDDDDYGQINNNRLFTAPQLQLPPGVAICLSHAPVFLMFGTDVTRGTKSNKPPAAVWSDVKFYCFVGSVPLIVTHETVSQFSWLQMDLSERKALIQGFSLMFVPLGCAVF